MKIINVAKWWPEIQRRAQEIVAQQALREEPARVKLLEELRDIQTSLTVHGVSHTNEWLLGISCRLQAAVDEYEKETKINKNDNCN